LLAVPAADLLVKAAALALMTRDENVSGVIGQVLNIPVTCHPNNFPEDKYEYGSYQQNKDGSVVGAPKMDWSWEQYLSHAEPEVYASPLLAKDLSKLPPARKCLR
jgi:acetyl esterase/lipase